MNFEEIVLSDISMRFIIPLTKEKVLHPERLYFALEEAYWFFLDFIVIRNHNLYQSFRMFCEKILIHNSLEFDEDDYRKFKIYKRDVPVYGAVVLNSEMDSILAVRGKGSTRFGFPKGKKSKDETGKECCCREVYEETGYDISNKITSLNVLNSRAVLFFVFNVSKNARFEPKTRFEISSVNWLKISDIAAEGVNGPYGLINKSIYEIISVINQVKINLFKFDISRIQESMKNV